MMDWPMTRLFEALVLTFLAQGPPNYYYPCKEFGPVLVQ